MKFNLAVTDHNLTYQETLQEVFQGIELRCDIVSIFHSRVEYVVNNLSKGTRTKLHGIIDYPLGIASIKNKVYAILEIIKLVDGVDVVINSPLFLDGEIEKIKEEIKQVSLVCRQNKKICQFMIDNRSMGDPDLFTICNILLKCGADNIILGTGMNVDSLADSLISAEYLFKNLKVKPVINTRELSGKAKVSRSSNILGLQGNSSHSVKALINLYK